MADLSIDCGTMSCPGPLVEIARTVKRMEPGQTLEVTASDQAFCADVRAWCELSGNELLELVRENGRCRALIRKR